MWFRSDAAAPPIRMHRTVAVMSREDEVLAARDQGEVASTILVWTIQEPVSRSRFLRVEVAELRPGADEASVCLVDQGPVDLADLDPVDEVLGVDRAAKVTARL